MRDYAIFVFVLGPIPFYFLSPVVGILAFHFVGFLNPHRFTWGIAYNFPFSLVIASVTVLGILAGRGERNKLPNERETFLFLIIWVIFIFSTLSSLNSNISLEELKKISKIFLMIILTLSFFCRMDKLRYLFWVITLSIGFLGLKGGIFGIVTGGNFRVLGPADSFITDNNDLGMALNITLPIIYGLSVTESNRKVRISLKLLFFLCVISSILTFSRGAIVALGFLLVAMPFMFGKKVMNMLIILFVLIGSSFFVTEKWIGRVESISNASADSSFLQRVNSWHTAWNMAMDRPILGAGLGTTGDEKIFQQYAPDPTIFHSSHSIYFQMVGENGFTGLIIFLSLYTGLLVSLHRVRNKMKRYTNKDNLLEYSSALELSLIAFMVNGLTLGRAYFDLAYLVMAMGIITKYLIKNNIEIASKINKEENQVSIVGV